MLPGRRRGKGFRVENVEVRRGEISSYKGHESFMLKGKVVKKGKEEEGETLDLWDHIGSKTKRCM